MTPIEGGARKRCVRPPEASFIHTHVAPMRPCFFGGPLFTSPENSGLPLLNFSPCYCLLLTQSGGMPSNKMIEAAGRGAGIEQRLRSHCLHHTTGSTLANGDTA